MIYSNLDNNISCPIPHPEVSTRQEGSPLKISNPALICFNDENKDSVKGLDQNIVLLDLKSAALPTVITPEIEKTAIFGSTLLKTIGETRPFIWGPQAGLKTLRFYMTLGVPIGDQSDLNHHVINELTGSIHLSKALQSLTPAISDWIFKTISGNTNKIMNAFVCGEKKTIEFLVSTILPALLANILKHIWDQNLNNKLPSDANVTIADIMVFICEIINKHKFQISQKIEQIERMPSGKKREKFISKSFTPLTNELLDIMLPNGLKSLPLNQMPFLSEAVWSHIKRHLIPQKFYEIYCQFKPVNCTTQKEAMVKRKQGTTLILLSQMAVEKVADLLPASLAENEIKDMGIGENVNESPFISFILKNFNSCLEGSESMKKWLAVWLSKELIRIGKCNHPNLKLLWNFLSSHLEPLLIHIFVNLSNIPFSVGDLKEQTPDVTGVILIRLLSLGSKFFNTNREKIKKRLMELKLAKKKIKNDKELLGIFELFATDLLCFANSDFPLPNSVKQTILDQFKLLMPQILLEQYHGIIHAKIDNTNVSKKLRSLLFDPKNLSDASIALKVVSALHACEESPMLNMFKEFYLKLWKESGTDRIALTVEAMIKHLASQSVHSIMLHFGVAQQLILQPKNNMFMHNINEWMQSFVENIFLEALVHIGTNIEEKAQPPKNVHPKCLFFVNVIIQVNNLWSQNLIGIGKSLEKLREIHKDPEAYQTAAYRLFDGLATDFCNFFGINPFKHLPLDEIPAGESIKESLWESVRSSILPAAAYKGYLEIIDWQVNLQNAYEELYKSYHSSHPKWACKVLSKYSTDFIRYYLRYCNEDAAELLLEAIKTNMLLTNNAQSQLINDTLSDLQVETEQLISENLKSLVDNEDPSFDAIWHELTNYAEASMAKFMAKLSNTIHEIEGNNPELLVDIAIQILKETADHFSTIARVTDEAEVDESYKVPLEAIFTAFGHNLHDGIPLNPTDSNEEKDLARLEGCFIPLTAKLLKLANLTIKDFPIPSQLQQQLGLLTVHQMLPFAFMRAFQKILEPQVRNSVMLSFLQTLYTALNTVELQKREGGLVEAAPLPNIKQKNLYAICGSVVLELVKLIPDTVVQYVFMKEKVKDMSAEAIGNAIMPYLSRWSLIQIIDAVIYSVLPQLHPSKWEGKQGNEDLIPRKAFVRADGIMELRPVTDFNFDFPITDAEKLSFVEANRAEAAEVRKELRDAFTKTISQQLYVKAWAFIKSLWSSFQDYLNKWIERNFSEKSSELKAKLDHLFKPIFFDILGNAIKFMFAPLISLIKLFIEKVIIDRRSEDIIENLQSEALENLLYKWTDTVINTLIRLQSSRCTS